LLNWCPKNSISGDVKVKVFGEAPDGEAAGVFFISGMFPAPPPSAGQSLAALADRTAAITSEQYGVLTYRRADVVAVVERALSQESVALKFP
jgi:hypothetical protein